MDKKIDVCVKNGTRGTTIVTKKSSKNTHTSISVNMRRAGGVDSWNM